jgi:transposase
MGHSRGGLTTKIHALVDAMGLPIMLKLTKGQAADALRAEMDARGAWANIRAMPQRTIKPVFSRFLYKHRNLVERFFNKLKHFRAVATRCDQRDETTSPMSNVPYCDALN